MNIVVCVKVINGEINPFDECAVECALQLGGRVSVVSMCPPSAKEPLRGLTRLGVERVILLSDKCFAGSDTLSTSYILSEAIKRLNPELVICGRQTIDGDTAQVGAGLAVRLRFNLITNVLSIDKADKEILCRTREGRERVSFPALITVERINTLRFPKMGAKMTDIEVWNNDTLGADESRCGIKGSPTRVLEIFKSTGGERHCKYIAPEDLLPLIEKLRNSTRTDELIKESKTKLKEVMIIGNEIYEKAVAISQNVIQKERLSAGELAELIRAEAPKVVLFPADLWGRKTAPQVAAMLNTGLCADCTALETDGKTLFMYRPAQSGNIIARIGCRTYPQMATVRISQKSSNVIISGGRGAGGSFDFIRKLSELVGGEMCASRGAVDDGLAPYDMQVGLTGKNVSPDVYVAIGISGAVHHTCAIEGAGTVIAINSDKKARIFDYADYGIVCSIDEIEKLIM